VTSTPATPIRPSPKPCSATGPAPAGGRARAQEAATIPRPEIGWLALGAALLAVGCGTTSDGARPDGGRASSAPSAAVFEEGRASYYSSEFDGRKTASGERYNPRAMTAAHARLPLGTWVLVTRRDGNHASVKVKVNDRCGCRYGRIIDLSHEAARRLGMLSAGVVPVRIEVLGR
jgi:rare lipoprotein A